MKKVIAFFMAAALISTTLYAETAGTTVITESDNIKIGSTTYALTKTTKQIAEGVKYITLEIPGKKATSSYVKGAKCYVLEADLTNPKVSVRHGDDYRDSQHTLTTMASSLSTSTSKVVGGVNANFWITIEKPYATRLKGEPFGVSIKDGVMYSDLNTNTAKHCGGPTKTGAMVIDGNGRCYIDWLKSQKTNNATGSGWNFNVVNTSVSSTPIALDQVNGVSCPEVASVYIKSAYGASKGFRQVTSSSDYSTATGTSNTIVYLNFANASDTKWQSGKQNFVIKKIERGVKVEGKTLGEYDVALVFRWSAMQNRVAKWAVGQTVTITTCVNFKSQGTATSIKQAVSGNSVTMANGEIGYIEQKNYNGKIYPRTIYATNTAGTKLWLIVIEHYPNKQYTYGGMTTTEATYVAKYLGATWAMQVDCGGSSQMYADGKQVSQSYDTGGVRAVQSGLFILSTPTATSGGVTTPTEPEEPETPTTSTNISASPASVTLNSTTATVDVKITAKNLTKEMTFRSATGSVTVAEQADWNTTTGGTLRFTLNKSFTPGTYTSYVAVQGGSDRLEIPVTATITDADNNATAPEEDTTTPDVETPETEAPSTQAFTASHQTVTLKGEKGVYPAPYVDVEITATGLSTSITYNSYTGAVVPSTLTWNELKGGTLRLTLNPDFKLGVGTYTDGYVAVRSGKNDSVFIRTHVTIVEPGTLPSEPETPEEPETPTTPTETPDFSAKPILTKVWDTNNVLAAANGRYGAGYNGKVYSADTKNKILYSWNAQGASKTEIAQTVGGGFALLSDGVGHLLVSKDGHGKSPTDWQIYDIATNTATDLTLTMPTDVTLGTYCYVHDNVALAGNLSSDATIFIAPRDQLKVAKITLKNGVQTAASVVATASENFSNDYNLALRDVAYNAIGNESFLWRKRGGDLNYFSNGAAKTIAVPSTKVNNTGLAIFTLNNIEYAVIATGLYMADGFSIFNLATGEVVASRANSTTTITDQYSSFNVEKVSESAVNIYFYKSGISCGMYKFAYPNTATELEQNTEMTMTCYTNNRTLYVEGVEVAQIDLYAITGQKICSVKHQNELSVEGLIGIYTAVIMDNKGTIFTKKIVCNQ